MQRFSVTIRGKTYTQNSFAGLAYVTGIPNALESMGDAVLEGTSSTSTSTVNPSSSTQNFTLASPVDFNIGDMVMARSTSSSSWSIGRISTINWPVITVVRQDSSGSTSSSWSLFLVRGTSYLSAPRVIGEGGHGDENRRNGITRMFTASRGYNKELIDGFPQTFAKEGSNEPMEGLTYTLSPGKSTLSSGWAARVVGGDIDMDSPYPHGVRFTPLHRAASATLQYGNSAFFSPFSGESLVSISLRPGPQPAGTLVGLFSPVVGVYLEGNGDTGQRFLVVTMGGITRFRYLLPGYVYGVGASPNRYCLLWFHPTKQTLDVYDTDSPETLDPREPFVSIPTSFLYAMTDGSAVLLPQIRVQKGSDIITSFYISQGVRR